jgi:hypothetical protein
MAGHTEGLQKDQFCSVRTEKCECGNKYREPCDKVAAKWNARGKNWSKYAAKYKEGAQERGHEAHHIASVASVTGKITANADIDKIVRKTKWCVNAAKNMIALPMWAHTLNWYFDLKSGDERSAKMGAPPFAGLAQHDYDHGLYLKEVDDSLAPIPKQVKMNAKAHEDPTGDLAAMLDSVIDTHKPQLCTGKNTHDSWCQAVKSGYANWYKAFSMVNGATPRTFPLAASGKDKMRKKFDEVRDAFLKLTEGT